MIDIGMAEPEFIAMSTQTYLGRVAKRLGGPEPLYYHAKSDPARVTVEVSPWYGAVCPFTGERGPNYEVSKELAARVAISVLKERYSIYIEDMSALLREADACLSWFYELKRRELTGEAPDKSCKDFCPDKNDFERVISADFYELLGLAAARFNIEVSSLETLCRGPDLYVSSLTLTRASHPLIDEDFLSGNCLNGEIAKEDVAKKALFYLLHLYRFVVIDITYDPITFELHRAFCRRRRDAYFALKKEKARVGKAPVPSIPIEIQGTLDAIVYSASQLSASGSSVQDLAITTSNARSCVLGYHTGSVQERGRVHFHLTLYLVQKNSLSKK